MSVFNSFFDQFKMYAELILPGDIGLTAPPALDPFMDGPPLDQQVLAESGIADPFAWVMGLNSGNMEAMPLDLPFEPAPIDAIPPCAPNFQGGFSTDVGGSPVDRWLNGNEFSG